MAVNSTDLVSSSNEERMVTIEYIYLSVYFGKKKKHIADGYSGQKTIL